MPVDLSAGIFLIQSRDLDSRQNGTLLGRSKLILAGRIPLSTCDGRGAGVDSAWKQKKLEARKMLDCPFGRAARREAAVPSVQSTLCWAAIIPSLSALTKHAHLVHGHRGNGQRIHQVGCVDHLGAQDNTYVLPDALYQS